MKILVVDELLANKAKCKAFQECLAEVAGG